MSHVQQDALREALDALRWPSEFVPFFCASHKGCTPDSLVTRIEFEYMEG